ncbi:uncharacterized protein BKA55DRAFT_542541 [Fusarium redolens]|uniref:Uncharacterized protein n=1 Tax=Fusarium redolens TaxID=48865 RepID=A0A9P9GK26_FUSRE|nr:uncharacterized protein BKA55DRAFT_542541 [Fusarium redolens]KAH7239942.1 hypothetical protein BKA55DRAFT_542541 [Fusarium redolens]
MQSPNPNIYEGDYLELDYRTPSLPVFDSPSRSLTGPSQALGEITEEDLTLAPSAYWDRFLSAELAKMVASKVPSPEYKPVETTIVVSVDKRSERNLRKQFPGLNQVTQLANTGGRQSRRGATGRQFAARDRLLAEQEDTSGSRPVWNDVYEVFHYTGVPCVNAGFYCWRDLVSKKHFKLDSGLLNKLVDYAEEGGLLRNHDHVPETIRERIFRQDQENLEYKQLKLFLVQDLMVRLSRTIRLGPMSPPEVVG